MEGIKEQVSTEGLEPAKALSFWEEHLHEIGLRGKISTTTNAPFFAKAVNYEFGKSTLYLYQLSASTHTRTLSDCSRNPSNLFSLSYVKKGSLVVTQGQNEALVNAGDCFLTYSGEPRCYRMLTPCEGTSLIVPRLSLQRWVPSPFDITATSFLKISPFGKALAAAFDALTPSSLDHMFVSPDAVTEQFCCLMALSAGPPKAVLTSYKQALFHRFFQSLRTRCCDPDFNQSALAHEHKISTRTIQTTFSCAGTSFGQELLAMRMRRARWFLDDYRYDKKSISEIANLLGYRRPNHFITHFHRVFGDSPAAYRKARRL
ncbi:MAG: AraC family transcriptional regulator [Bdellovibrionales bacterium]|jgi:AraC-like DNA-binding protein